MGLYFSRMYEVFDAWTGYWDILGLSKSRPVQVGNGDIIWYYGGKIHKEYGPAVERAGGYSWYIDGKLHRFSGPAIIQNGGPDQWYIHGHQVENIQKMYEVVEIANALADVFKTQDFSKLDNIYKHSLWEHI